MEMEVQMETHEHGPMWSALAAIVDDPVALREQLLRMSPDVLLIMAENFVKWRISQMRSDKKYKEEHGVTRSWKYLQRYPDKIEHHKQYNREYMRRRREAAPRCENDWCDSPGTYGGKCLRCTVYQNPDHDVSKKYKAKEHCVVDFLKEQLPTEMIVCDKQIDGGCSRRRPDIFIDKLTHSVIVEIDENQHESYDCTCENRRLMELFEDLGRRPLVMIRFNPDGYIDKNSKEVKSCFSYRKPLGVPYIPTK